MSDFIFFEIELGDGIYVEKGVLGKKYESKIHGIDTIIEFPQISPKLTHTAYSSEKYLLSPESLIGGGEDKLDWGKVMAIDRNDEIEVSVRKVVLIIPFTNQREGEIIISKVDTIERCVELFRQYLSIYTKQSFAQKYYDIRPDIKYVTTRQTRQLLDRKFSKKYPFVGHVHQLSYEAIGSDIINEILNYASKLKDPPLEYQLLLEARKLFYQQKYRSTVFECSSSAEVLLTSRIENYVEKNYNSDFKDSLLSKYNGLKSKYDLASYLKLFHKSYRIEELAKLRNDAIHAGAKVERKEAAEALEITDDFIYSEITHLFE